MMLLATCQTLETLEALERNRQAETTRRKVIRSVYSDTSPPSSFFHRRILRNCNALVADASSGLFAASFPMTPGCVRTYPPGKKGKLLNYFFSSLSPEAPGAEPPRNRRRPSAKVKSLPTARLELSFAW
jgi:hypothetical protein